MKPTVPQFCRLISHILPGVSGFQVVLGRQGLEVVYLGIGGLLQPCSSELSPQSLYPSQNQRW